MWFDIAGKNKKKWKKERTAALIQYSFFVAFYKQQLFLTGSILNMICQRKNNN